MTFASRVPRVHSASCLMDVAPHLLTLLWRHALPTLAARCIFIFPRVADIHLIRPPSIA